MSTKKVTSIKNWNVVQSGVSFKSASAMFKAQAINGTQYDFLAIRNKHRMCLPGINDIDREQFYSEEILNDVWEILVPDDELEQKTEKLRNMLKEDGFCSLTYKALDNMSINEMWKYIIEKLNNSEKDVKYKILMTIIREKLYKKQ